MKIIKRRIVAPNMKGYFLNVFMCAANDLWRQGCILNFTFLSLAECEVVSGRGVSVTSEWANNCSNQ